MNIGYFTGCLVEGLRSDADLVKIDIEELASMVDTYYKYDWHKVTYIVDHWVGDEPDSGKPVLLALRDGSFVVDTYSKEYGFQVCKYDILAWKFIKGTPDWD